MPLTQNNAHQCVAKRLNLLYDGFDRNWFKNNRREGGKGWGGEFFCFVLKLMLMSAGWIIPAGSRWRRLTRLRDISGRFGWSAKENQSELRILHFINSHEIRWWWAYHDLLFLLHRMRFVCDKYDLFFPNDFSLVFNICFNRRGDQISLFLFKWAVSFLWGLEGGGEFQIWKLMRGLQ